MIKFNRYYGGFWIRVFGVGLVVQDRKKIPPLFSERYGHKKVYRFGKYAVKFLKYRRLYEPN